MKIAIVTDDEKTISAHFGRATKYVVVTVEGNAVTDRQVLDKAGHREFQHDHDHHDHNHGHGQHDSRGHGFGKHAGERHQLMFTPIQDCQVLLARGMGRGARIGLEGLGIRPILTELREIDDAVQAVIDGSIQDHPERLH